ncbi:DUF2079 domain-containing protein [Streptosporangium saharense]|uniref:Putative membrane protein n=1 Tax=Streptosporangium saharense TaxID=1706840 RepID=A0A7W7VNY9_9ACTN|nr:DUF2079 domain-containing protein [Streptosporangium saharense]MBB4917367.1 putative membrane protein [Streptosporangium saharense]
MTETLSRRNSLGGANVPEKGLVGARSRAPLFFVTVLSALLYSAYSLVSFARFRAGAYDLVIFDQAVRSYSRLGPPVAIVKGVHNDFGAQFSVLGDHWSPILAVLSPFYRIHDGPETLLVLQAILLASAIPFLWKYAFRAFSASPMVSERGAERMAYCVAIAYAISWPVAETVAFDFHEAAFVPLLTAVLLERHQANRKWHVLVVAFLILQVKEDMGLLVAGLGLFFMTRKGDRAFGALFVLMGAAATYLCTQVLIPHFGGRSDYYWAYSGLGHNFREAALHALTHPFDALALLATPPVKVQTVILLLAPLLFASVMSPITISVVPLVMERMLSSSFPNWWDSKYHYNAFIVMVIFVGGVDGYRRLTALMPISRGPGRLGRAVLWWPSLVLLVSIAMIPFFAFGRFFSADFYASTPRTEAAAVAVAAVPDDALVEAANNVAPALSSRTRTLLWDRTVRWAPWVIADVQKRVFPFLSLDEQTARVTFLLRNGYRVVFSSAGYIVLARTGN